jgi:hypothetical protein
VLIFRFDILTSSCRSMSSLLFGLSHQFQQVLHVPRLVISYNFLTMSLLHGVKCNLPCFQLGAWVAEQHRLLPRSTHHHRQVLFIVLTRSCLSLAFEYKRIFCTAHCRCPLVLTTPKSDLHFRCRARECTVGGTSSFDGNYGGSRYC